MSSFKVVSLTLFALVFSAFGQKQEQPVTDKPGMVWFWFDGAKKANVEWDAASATREKAFAGLAEKIKEGDKNKIRLYMGRVNDAQSMISTAWAVGNDYSRNLEENAGVALQISGNGSRTGKMTEAEYDEAMGLIKTLRQKIAGRPTTEAQKKIWADAVKTIGEDLASVFYQLNK